MISEVHRALIAQRMRRVSPQNCAKTAKSALVEYSVDVGVLMKAATGSALSPSPHIRRMKRKFEGRVTELKRLKAAGALSPAPITKPALRTTTARQSPGSTPLRSKSSRNLHIPLSAFPEQRETDSDKSPMTPGFRPLQECRSIDKLLNLCQSYQELRRGTDKDVKDTSVSDLRSVGGDRPFRIKSSVPRLLKVQHSATENSPESLEIYKHIGKQRIWRISSRSVLRSTDALLARNGNS